MGVRIDKDRFDSQQNALVGDLVRSVHDVLVENEVPKDSVNKLTASIAFRICGVLDGSHGDSSNLRLAFAVDGNHTDLVMLDNESSWLHEYVHGWVTELYDTAPAAKFEKPTAGCPHCGEPLRTPTARYCRFCKMDWRDPNNVYERT